MSNSVPTEIIRNFNHRGEIPKNKKITMTVMFGMFCHAYQVKTITNTTYYKPGEWMTAEVLDQINLLDNWETQCFDDDIMNAITNTVGAATALKTVPGLI